MGQISGKGLFMAQASQPSGTQEQRVETFVQAFRTLRAEMQKVIVGHDDVVNQVLVGLFAGGHVLLEGVPGLGKTLLIKTLSECLDLTFSRIQFTPDLVPSDVVGTRVLKAGGGGFDVELGPVFTNFLLADEINRAPAKVQSALLEVMQEQQVTIAGTTYRVPEPFLVLATQNPIESEGTYPLPEAQTDRFLMKLVIDYPDTGEEASIVGRSLAGFPEPRERLSLPDLAGYRVVDVKVDFYDGKMHPVDSKDVAFQIAGYFAFKESFVAARPCLLEPIYTVEIRIRSIELWLPIAGMGFRANRGSLPEDFPYSLDRVFFFDPAKKQIEFAPGVVVPAKPFWGVIGVAPPPSMGRVPSGPPNVFGGNLDNHDLQPGTSMLS